MQPAVLTRLYRIQHNLHYFCAGCLANGNQMLMGIQLPEIVCVEFDAAGNYLGVVAKEIAGAKSDASELEGEKLTLEMQVWQSEMGLVPGTISVAKFFLPDRWIGIQDLPDYCREALEHPEDFEQERLAEIQADIREWQESGDFVLYWDEDYFLSSEGEVVGS